MNNVFKVICVRYISIGFVKIISQLFNTDFLSLPLTTSSQSLELVLNWTKLRTDYTEKKVSQKFTQWFPDLSRELDKSNVGQVKYLGKLSTNFLIPASLMSDDRGTYRTKK